MHPSENNSYLFRCRRHSTPCQNGKFQVEFLLMDTHEEQGFSCPYCSMTNSATIDLLGPISQEFVSDCEVCCKPIVIKCKIDKNQIIFFEAERENG